MRKMEELNIGSKRDMQAQRDRTWHCSMPFGSTWPANGADRYSRDGGRKIGLQWKQDFSKKNEDTNL